MEKDQGTDHQGNDGYKQSRYKRGPGPTGRSNWTNRGCLLRCFPLLDLRRDLWVAKIIFVDIKKVQAQAVLHLTLAQIMQVRLPVPVLEQIFGYMRGQKNMPGIAALQHALGNIYSRSGKVRFVVHIAHSIDWAIVNSHPHLNMRMILQGPAYLQSASHRFFGATKEKERHSVARRHSIEFAACLGSAKRFRSAHDLIQLLKQFDLLVDEQFRITDHVD